MGNIFEISNKLLNIFNELEENGGELTEELEQELNVTESDFKDKIQSYVNVIKLIDSDVCVIDDEIARLNDLKRRKNKTIDRLKSIVIYAIENFGETTKSGGKYIEYPTGKVSVRNTKKVNVHTESVNDIVKFIDDKIRFDKFANTLDEKEEIDKEELLKELTSFTLHDKDDIKPCSYELNDDELHRIKANVSISVPLDELIKDKFPLIKQIANTCTFDIKGEVSKSEIKKDLNNGTDLHNVGNIENNKSLIIK
jgi:hypothetical protein